MTILKRLGLVFKAKANMALDNAEDPRETLDYSYQKQLDLLTQVRRGVADVATSRKRLELQSQQIDAASQHLAEQAQQALGSGREDLAREALTRRSALQEQREDLDRQHQGLVAEEDKLTAASQRLESKVEAFRTHKETIKATYTAAEAESKIGEAVSGISEEMGDVGMAVQRAEDKTSQMRARAGAIDELLASGALDDVSAGPGGRDDLQTQLDALGSNAEVDTQLAQMKAGLPSPTPRRALTPGTADPEGAQST
jgi:phage shock protein A